MGLRFGFVFVLATCVCSAQELLTGNLARSLNQILDTPSGPAQLRNDLKCDIQIEKPFLDFSLRFIAGYTFTCPVNIFGGKPSKLRIFSRVTPEGKTPVVLADEAMTPEPPHHMAGGLNMRKIRSAVEGSGAFLVDEGEYRVEVLLVDGSNRSRYKSWHIKAERTRRENSLALTALPSGPVCPLSIAWSLPNAKRESPLRLTILLDAAPIYPHALRIRAWDRELLIGSVWSILNEVPAASIRLVAFNMDQSSVVFRAEHFTADDLPRLSQALRDMELGKISYRQLTESAPTDLLSRLVEKELLANPVPGAVIFAGPWNRRDAIFEKTERIADSPPQFFDIVYYGWFLAGREFPDAIQRITLAEHGTVVKVHSPAELAKSLQKIAFRLEGAPATQAASR